MMICIMEKMIKQGKILPDVPFFSQKFHRGPDPKDGSRFVGQKEKSRGRMQVEMQAFSCHIYIIKHKIL